MVIWCLFYDVPAFRMPHFYEKRKQKFRIKELEAYKSNNERNKDVNSARWNNVNDNDDKKKLTNNEIISEHEAQKFPLDCF